MKKCSKCNNEFPDSCFSLRKTKNKTTYLYSICKKCEKKRIEAYRKGTKKGAVSKRLMSIRFNCKKKNIQYNLSTDWVLNRLEEINWTCEVTKEKMMWNLEGKTNRKGKPDNVWSIDRIDPKGGYVVENIRFVTHKLNMFRKN